MGHLGDSEAVSLPDCCHPAGSLSTDLPAIKVVADTVMGGRYLGNHGEGMGSHGVQGRRASQHEGDVGRESSQRSLNLPGLDLQDGDGEILPWA